MTANLVLLSEEREKKAVQDQAALVLGLKTFWKLPKMVS
jgi:hypothetical protein